MSIHLTCCIHIQDFVLNDKPQPLALLLITLGLEKMEIPTNGRVVCVCGHLKHKAQKTNDISRHEKKDVLNRKQCEPPL